VQWCRLCWIWLPFCYIMYWIIIIIIIISPLQMDMIGITCTKFLTMNIHKLLFLSWQHMQPCMHTTIILALFTLYENASFSNESIMLAYVLELQKLNCNKPLMALIQCSVLPEDRFTNSSAILQAWYLLDISMIRTRDELFQVSQAVSPCIGINKFRFNIWLPCLLSCHLEIPHQILPTLCKPNIQKINTIQPISHPLVSMLLYSARFLNGNHPGFCKNKIHNQRSENNHMCLSTIKTWTWYIKLLILGMAKHHTMKAYWVSGCIAQRILDLGTRWWRGAVSFTTQPLYPQGKNP